MKQQTVNEFKDGLNLDLHPLVTPKTVLTDNINGTFITYNGNEFCLQNDRGNKKVAELTPGYTPIGIKEHNGILYIVSVNGDKTEIGTYPSPNYDLYNVTEEDYVDEEFDEDKYNNRVFGEWHYNDSLEYQPLHVLGNRIALTNQSLGYNINTPVTIEIQDSYDGSVNLILVADKKVPRLINSGFSVNGNAYKFVNRNQSKDTNIYDNLKYESELIRTNDQLTNIKLLGVQGGGQWKGGNYTFYIKFGDADYNQTDVVAESGIVSIFKGNDCVPSTISGTLLDERTDKMIHLEITGLNPIYSKMYIYFTREYSDTQGYRMTECGMLTEPININIQERYYYNQHLGGPFVEYYQQVWLTGFEQQSSINIEELNVDYHTIDWARAETQHSNMLFLGNIGQEETFELYKKLDKFTKTFNVVVKQDLEQDEGLLKVSNDYLTGEEYYSTTNIYSKLGYWPDEIYRFGIVYILRDGSNTPVFNVNGGVFTGLDVPVENNEYFNTDGVFLTPKVDIISNLDRVKPLYFRFTLPNDISLLEQNGIIGWFVVRQKRIPRTICQGLSIGIDEKSHLPMIWNGDDWMIESFLSLDRTDKDKQLELIKEINKLKEDNQWTWARTLGVLSALPIFGIFVNPFILATAITYGTHKTISAKTKLKLLEDHLNEDKKPMLQYLAGSFKEFETDTYGLRYGSLAPGTSIENDQYYHAAYENYEKWEEGYKEEPKVIANKAYLIDLVENVSSTIYEYQYLLVEPELSWIHTEPYESTYLYIISNDPDYLSDVVIERDGKNKRIVLLTNDSDVTTLLSETVNFNLNDTTLSWIENENALIRSYSQYRDRYILESVANLKGRGILSLDPCVNSTISGMLDGSVFKVQEEYRVNCAFGPKKDNNDLYFNDNYLKVDHSNYRYIATTTNPQDLKCVYVAPNTNIKVVDNYEFSNIAGVASEVSKFKHATKSFYKEISSGVLSYVSKTNEENNDLNLIRGKFVPYIGVVSNDLNDSRIYSVRLNETTDLSNLLLVRQQDNSEYYCVSNRNSIVLDDNENTNAFDVYRGDCYTNTVTMRIINNFVDPVAPVSEQIVDPEGWYKMLVKLDAQNNSGNNSGSGNNSDTNDSDIWNEVNLSDVNTVDLGFWVTFKCLSSYNLGLRSADSFHTDEMAMFGSPRLFYPLNSMSTETGNKIEESFLLNDGLSATVGRKRYNLMPDVPYSKSEFSNRIMFSNVNVTDAFTNGYRTFQGLSYKDYDKQYGAITKLISLGQNIFVVMEHGLGLVPVNPKALMQTTTGEAIHIYGYGVLPDEMTIISQDYGSKYEHSVIRTPIGIYGVDVDAKKIWRFSDKQGFETISDMKIETYLKDFLSSRQIEMGTSDIRTHYNGKKGDLMFAWYPKANENPAYMICYNERQNIWTTKYDWYPIVSENINDEFYSLNNEAIWDHAEDVGYNNTHVSSWYDNNHKFEFEFVVSDPVGVNKVFDNLQIISNNVQPDEMEITVIGDDYVFKRTPVDLTSGHKERGEYEDVLKIHTTSNIHGDLESTQTETEHSPKGYYHFDKRLNQSALTKWQPFKDMYKFGRRVGNIQYKEGSWFAQIEPLLITDERLVAKEARIRDKWAKIRIRYSGKDLAIITTIKTLINI